MSSFGVILIMVVVLVVAAGLRFHWLGVQSFWNDEGNSYVQATRSLSEIAANAARDIHPPGYYWLLALWRPLVGETEFALRSLSAFASVVSVAFAFALGKRLFASGAGVMAALLVALNSFSIYYAQETRMYALLAMWAAAGMWVFVGFARRPTWRWAVALGLVNAAGLWTQYAYAFLMLAQGVLMVIWVVELFTPPRKRRGVTNDTTTVSRIAGRTLALYVAANLLAIGLFLPWLPTAIHQITTWPSAGEPSSTAQAINVVLGWLMFGMTYGYTSPGSFAIGNFLLLFGLLPMRANGRGRWAMLVPVLWVLVTLAVFFVFHLFRQQNLKLLLPAQIGLALWLARGLWMLWAYWQHHEAGVNQRRQAVFRLAAVAGGAWLVFNLGQAAPALYQDADFQRADYRAIVARIEDHLGSDDAIILDAPNQEEVFRYYYRGDAPVYTLPAGLGGDDEATRAAVETIIAAHPQAFAVYWGETERDPNRVVETTLDSETFEVGDTWYGDVRLARYAMPATFGTPEDIGVRFGEHITLMSAALSGETVAPGDVLQVQLNWSTDTVLDKRYKVFLQLLNENGTLVAQRDSEPGGGLSLTTIWTPGEVVTDRHGLVIPDDLPPAHYLLIVGLYDINDATARLPINSTDHFVLSNIQVQGA